MGKRADQSGRMRPIRSKNMGRPVLEVEGSAVMIVRCRPGDLVGVVDEGVLEECIVELTGEGGVVDLESEIDDGLLRSGRGVEGGERSEAVADVEEVEGIGKRVMREPGESFCDGGDFEKVGKFFGQRRCFLESLALEKTSSLLVLGSAPHEKHCSCTECGCKRCGDRFSGRGELFFWG